MIKTHLNNNNSHKNKNTRAYHQTGHKSKKVRNKPPI